MMNLQYIAHLMRRTNSFEKTLMLEKIEGRRRMGWQMIEWHHQLNTHEFEQVLGVADRQGNLVAAVRGVAKSRTWQWVNRTELINKRLNLSFWSPLYTPELTWVHLYSFLFRKTFIQMYISSFFPLLCFLKTNAEMLCMLLFDFTPGPHKNLIHSLSLFFFFFSIPNINFMFF